MAKVYFVTVMHKESREKEQRFPKPFLRVLGCRRRSLTVDLFGFRCVSGSRRLWAVGGGCAQMFPYQGFAKRINLSDKPASLKPRFRQRR